MDSTDVVIDEWTRRLNAAGKRGTCELCGREADLRPYGPDFEFICIPCGAKDPEAVSNAILHILGLKDVLDEETKEKLTTFLAMKFEPYAAP